MELNGPTETPSPPELLKFPSKRGRPENKAIATHYTYIGPQTLNSFLLQSIYFLNREIRLAEEMMSEES